MPGNVSGVVDVPVELFSGRVTDMPPSDLPMGVSPDEQDNKFTIGSVQSREGLTSVFTPIVGDPAINYMKTYPGPTLQNVLLEFDSLGRLWAELTAGILTQLASGTFITPGDYAQSSTLFSREYMAFSDGQFGKDVPRQYDGTNFDRVSQVGPGAGPSGFYPAVFAPLVPAVYDVSFALSALSRTGGIISGTTTQPHGLAVGDLVNIDGVSDTSFNGQWPVAAVGSTTFTAWGAPGQYAINTLARAANIVTAALPSAPFVSVGDTIIVANADDPGFDGIFTVTAVSGTMVEWDQVGANVITAGGDLYTQAITVPVLTVTNTADGTGDVVLIQLQSGQNNPFQVAGSMIIAGNSDSHFNGTFSVLSVNNAQIASDPANSRRTNIATGSTDAAGAGGKATVSVANSSPSPVTGIAGLAGSISAGVHQVSVIFVTRQGYLTKPSPPVEWIAAGGFTAIVSNMPVPNTPNIVARIVSVTTAGGATFFYQSTTGFGSTNMVITNNALTFLTINFDDTLLTNDVTYLFGLVELGECAGCVAYSSRLFWWGERNKIQNMLNLTFDGGFGNDGAGNVPLGWTNDPTNNGSGLLVNTSPIWGGMMTITGSGILAIRGLCYQSAYQDYLGVNILQVNTSYSIRVRVMSYMTLTQGLLNFDLYSPTTGIAYGFFAVPFEAVTGTPIEFIGLLTPGIINIPTDLQFRYYVNGTPNAGGGFSFDNIEIFPTNQPYNTTTVRGSYVSDPESYDGVTGLLNIAPENGQEVTAGFVLREKLYLVKTGSLYETTDDGQNEPSSWSITEISNHVGTNSVQGVDVAEEWAAIADRDGLYIYWGPEPAKVSQEIQPDWDRINWDAGATLWVKIDTKLRRVYVGAPLDGATKPSHILMLDYRGCGTPQEIAEGGAVKVSSYSGKTLAIDKDRKWSLWNIAANSAALVERPNGTAATFFGNNVGNGKTYMLDASNLTDDGAAIASYYWTFFFLPHDLEQQLGVGAHRKLYYYLAMYVEGAGKLNMSYAQETLGRENVLPPLTLASPAYNDLELPLNIIASRAAFKLALDGQAGSWYKLQRFIPSIKTDPWSPVRGIN